MGQVGGQRRDAVANRQAVIDAAAAMLPENPNASMQEIADYTGLGRSTVYRHFPNREALFRGMIRDVIASAGADVDGIIDRGRGAEETVGAIGSHLAELGLRYRFLYSHRQEVAPPLQTITRSDATPLARYLTAAQQRREVRADLPATWFITQLVALQIAIVGDVTIGRVRREDAGRILGATAAAMVAPR